MASAECQSDALKIKNDKLRAASHQYKAKCASQRASPASFKGSSSIKARRKTELKTSSEFNYKSARISEKSKFSA